jgi:hypothetical protein
VVPPQILKGRISFQVVNLETELAAHFIYLLFDEAKAAHVTFFRALAQCASALVHENTKSNSHIVGRGMSRVEELQPGIFGYHLANTPTNVRLTLYYRSKADAEAAHKLIAQAMLLCVDIDCAPVIVRGSFE